MSCPPEASAQPRATAIAAGVRDAAERFAGELTDDIQVLVLRCLPFAQVLGNGLARYLHPPPSVDGTQTVSEHATVWNTDISIRI